MRRYNLHVPAVGWAMIVLGVSTGGCFKYHEDCALTYECPSQADMARLTPPPPPPPNPECIPGESGWLPPESCGVFLSQSLGDDAGKGTMDKPVKTFRQAIQLATEPREKRVVYACAEEFKESVLIETDVTIYGGFQCGRAWTYLGNEKKTYLTTTSEAMGWDRIPLTIKTDTSSDRPVRIHNVHVKALEGADGGSSIAAYVNQATVHLANCKLEASNGADGRPGDSYEPESKGAQGLPGNPGKLSCSDSPVMGGEETEKKCEGGGSSFGGAGGEGHVDIGKNGDEGYPIASGGIGGLGLHPDSEGDDVPCENGTPGADGSVGESGPGGSKSNSLADFLETLTLGEDGQVGSWGKPGQGGGGGGGSKSGGKGTGKCASPLDGGASGGSGGTGGCGGLGGPGGHAGGSSIALVSLGATLTLEGVELVARDGGRGGNGGSGQEGGSGGAGGAGGPNTGFVNTKPGCSGGAGGNGGKGGTGGGGAGGYSVGIAYRGTAPVIAEEGILIGKAGAGGASDTETSKGGAGEAINLHLFSE